MAVRLSGNCDVAGRVRDKNHTNTMAGEHKSAHEQAGSLTMSEADRLCENEKERENEEFQKQWQRKKYSLGTQSESQRGSQLVTDVHAFPSRSVPAVQM